MIDNLELWQGVKQSPHETEVPNAIAERHTSATPIAPEAKL
jgi:hypothetical protein